jgi:hypothetical protein
MRRLPLFFLLVSCSFAACGFYYAHSIEDSLQKRKRFLLAFSPLWEYNLSYVRSYIYKCNNFIRYYLSGNFTKIELSSQDRGACGPGSDDNYSDNMRIKDIPCSCRRRQSAALSRYAASRTRAPAQYHGIDFDCCRPGGLVPAYIVFVASGTAPDDE